MTSWQLTASIFLSSILKNSVCESVPGLYNMATSFITALVELRCKPYPLRDVLSDVILE